MALGLSHAISVRNPRRSGAAAKTVLAKEVFDFMDNLMGNRKTVPEHVLQPMECTLDTVKALATGKANTKARCRASEDSAAEGVQHEGGEEWARVSAQPSHGYLFCA